MPYVTFACTEAMNRMLPGQVPLDSYVTVSALYADGHMDTATGKTPQTVPSGYQNVCCNGNVYFGYYGGLARVVFHNMSNSVDVVAVKLELGSVQTLEPQDSVGNWVLNDPPPNYQQELAKCQRYQVVCDGMRFIGMANRRGADQLELMMPVPVPMCKAPTLVRKDTGKAYGSIIEPGVGTIWLDISNMSVNMGSTFPVGSVNIDCTVAQDAQFLNYS